DLAHEEALAADDREARRRQAIALGAHRHDLGVLAVRAQRRRDALRLGQREGARPRADPDHALRPRPKSSWTSVVHERPRPARPDSRSFVTGACRILLTIALESASI